MKYKNNTRKRSQGGGINRLLKNKPRGKMAKNVCEWRTTLPHWKIINNKEMFLIVLQAGSRSSAIHHKKCVYFYNINYYEILK